MKKFYSLLAAVAMTASVSVFGQTTIAEWTPATLVGGTNNFGPSPWTASTADANVAVGGLTRGAGIGTTGSGAGNAWGGADFRIASSTESTAIEDNEFVTFTVTAKTGYKVSITRIDPYNIRRSSTGPSTGQWQYQIGSDAFTNIGSAITWGGTTSNAGNNQSAIDLSAITALQDLEAGTVVTFRILLYGATGTAGSWYLNGHANATAKTLTIKGTVEEEEDPGDLAVGDVNATKANLVKNTIVENSILFAAKADVQIVNMNGQVVKSVSVNENTSVDVSSLAKGTYIVTGSVNGKAVSQKIIKK